MTLLSCQPPVHSPYLATPSLAVDLARYLLRLDLLLLRLPDGDLLLRAWSRLAGLRLDLDLAVLSGDGLRRLLLDNTEDFRSGLLLYRLIGLMRQSVGST